MDPMAETLHEDKTFDKIDYAGREMRGKEFLNCTFTNCNFEKADLAGNDFFDCVFRNCNMSMVKLNKTGLKNVQFFGCKLIGVDFTPCNDFLFGVAFTDCLMDYAAFQQKKMKKTIFRSCSLKESHFSGLDLSGSVFDQCDLMDALFQDNNLEKVDFVSARHFTINPTQNKMKKAKFSVSGLPGLLGHLDLEIE